MYSVAGLTTLSTESVNFVFGLGVYPGPSLCDFNVAIEGEYRYRLVCPTEES